MIVRCVTAAHDASDKPTFHVCRIEGDEDKIGYGDHHVAAREQAEKEGCHGQMVTFDESDGPNFLFDNLDWGKASKIKI